MSGYCVTKVLESGLEEYLKKTAVACATFAADDGSRIWPAIRTIAALSEQNVRTVKRHLKILRNMKPPVLVMTQAATQHRPAHYRMLLDNLPLRRLPVVHPPEEPLLPVEDAVRPVTPVRPVRPVTPVTPVRPVPGVTPTSLLDARGDTNASRGDTLVSPDPSQRSSTSTERTAAAPQRDYPPPNEHAHTDTDYTNVVTAVVTKDILPRRLTDEALLAATIARCVELHIACPEDVARKAVDSALFRYYRALRLTHELPPDPRGIYHDHVTPAQPRLPMPLGVKRPRAKKAAGG